MIHQSRRYLFLIFLALSVSNATHAQGTEQSHTTGVKKNMGWMKSMIAPTILISTGILATTDNDLINKLEIQEERNESYSKFRSHVDDYLQYAPIVAVYSLNAFGVKGKHDLANRTALIIKSELIMTAMVWPLKKLTAVPRPDSGSPNSFPSGHTAQAFAAATFLHKEFGKDHPLYSILAYTSATGIGVLRVMNNRHWVSDVLVGAGIGILATNLAYLTHQNKWGHHKKLSGMMITPTYGQRACGLYLRIPVN